MTQLLRKKEPLTSSYVIQAVKREASFVKRTEPRQSSTTRCASRDTNDESINHPPIMAGITEEAVL
jgi:hypothetical protein